jgi:hypothetical protein
MRHPQSPFRVWAPLFSLALTVITPTSHSAAAPDSKLTQGQWSAAKANEWYDRQPWLVGRNFLPSTAVNDVEMWQKDTFDFTDNAFITRISFPNSYYAAPSDSAVNVDNVSVTVVPEPSVLGLSILGFLMPRPWGPAMVGSVGSMPRLRCTAGLRHRDKRLKVGIKRGTEAGMRSGNYDRSLLRPRRSAFWTA